MRRSDRAGPTATGGLRGVVGRHEIVDARLERLHETAEGHDVQDTLAVAHEIDDVVTRSRRAPTTRPR